MHQKPENPQIKENSPLYPCELFDIETLHKVSRLFLPGLASACVDYTTGDIFRNPESVVVDIRKEMVEYLTTRSEIFVAESVILDHEVAKHAYDVIYEFIDDFVNLKRNMLSGVSIWMLSERREDRIDDFVEELEMSQFWLTERREAIAKTLIKNIDYKHEFHCDVKFDSEKELAGHIQQCGFRTINCTNEGCNSKFTADKLEKHDSVCPFKLLACEQKCSVIVRRRDMDRHCITICSMKLVNCPFYQVNCRSTIPRCEVEQHNIENISSHVLCVLRVIHKEDSIQDLEERVAQLQKFSSVEQLGKAGGNVRSLMLLIKRLEAKLGPFDTSSKTTLRSSMELQKRKGEEDEM
jgi:hypothetical protein